MSAIRLYCPDVDQGEMKLPPEEANHAVNALRATLGAEVTLFDGEGREGRGMIVHISKHEVRVEIATIQHHPFEFDYRLTLAVAMGKAHRQAYVIEKCTELGVAAIWPTITERSVTRLKGDILPKWSRRAVEAAKQSGRRWVPRFESPQLFSEVIARVSQFDSAVIADIASGSTPFIRHLQECTPNSEIMCLIGPEGGWTDDERKVALSAGISSVTLGPTTLRTETAAATVCAAASLLTRK